ncbi:hypothetical protein CMEL01_01456 [Colletotrichum melonis]|uniref:Uncharacterized protein n=1 Tax=Colletotrichum melonis TaxID=1209925 RepID=A0AAI9V326_9PEZI|nr:hypothetical protein CMEL01_01456 [Colletotrichum melonis]
MAFPKSRLAEDTAVKVHEPDGKHRAHQTPSSQLWPGLATSRSNQKMTSNGAFVLGAGPFGHPISSQTHSEYVST